jgi:hypothetical protein
MELLCIFCILSNLLEPKMIHIITNASYVLGDRVKKLTLTAELKVIHKAKQLAEARGTNVSKMFSQFIQAEAEHIPSRPGTIAPITRRLTGIARAPRGKSDRQLIEDALLLRHS